MSTGSRLRKDPIERMSFLPALVVRELGDPGNAARLMTESVATSPRMRTGRQETKPLNRLVRRSLLSCV